MADHTFSILRFLACGDPQINTKMEGERLMQISGTGQKQLGRQNEITSVIHLG